MARILSDKTVFYRLDFGEAYETDDGIITREARDGLVYLGDRVNPETDTNIEVVRVKRAVTLLEKSGGRLLRQTKDKGSRQRLAHLCKAVLRFDPEFFTPGLRSVHQGLTTSAGRALLQDFDFNAGSAPGAELGTAYSFDLKQGVLCLHHFSPELLLSKTTHVPRLQVRFLLSQVDFLNGYFFTICSDVEHLTAEDPVQDLRLSIGELPDIDGVYIGYLWIGFERDDAVAISELLWHVNDVFRLVVCVVGPQG